MTDQLKSSFPCTLLNIAFAFRHTQPVLAPQLSHSIYSPTPQTLVFPVVFSCMLSPINLSLEKTDTEYFKAPQLII